MSSHLTSYRLIFSPYKATYSSHSPSNYKVFKNSKITLEFLSIFQEKFEVTSRATKRTYWRTKKNYRVQNIINSVRDQYVRKNCYPVLIKCMHSRKVRTYIIVPYHFILQYIILYYSIIDKVSLHYVSTLYYITLDYATISICMPLFTH